MKRRWILAVARMDAVPGQRLTCIYHRAENHRCTKEERERQAGREVDDEAVWSGDIFEDDDGAYVAWHDMEVSDFSIANASLFNHRRYSVKWMALRSDVANRIAR